MSKLKTSEEIGAETEEILDAAKAISEKLDKVPENSGDEKALKGELTELEKRLAGLESDKKAAMREAEITDMRASLTTLEGVIEELREPDLMGGTGQKAAKGAEKIYGPDSEHSYFADIKAVSKNGDNAARERIEAAAASDQKAMVTYEDSAGGYLVPQLELPGLVGMRERSSILRGLFSSLSVDTDSIQIQAQTSGLLAGWVAELAEKPFGEMTFGEITAGVFTAAGLAVASNQLISSSKYGLDALIFNDLAKRLAALEEIAFLAGSGVGQPLGILNTPGVQTTDCGTATVVAILDKVLEAIGDIYENYNGAPSAIVLHPQMWTKIVSARESSAPSTYLVGAGESPWGRRANDPVPNYNGPRGELFGLPVYTTSAVPTNLGAADNETCILVANWSEGLILDREGIRNDTSEHVKFTSNQTVFRAEERVGFTASRNPEAFNVVGGAGLVLP